MTFSETPSTEQDARKTNVAIIAVHGIGETRDGDLTNALETLLEKKGTECAVQEVNWADLNRTSESTISGDEYSKAIQAAICSASCYCPGAGSKTNWILCKLVFIANSIVAQTPLWLSACCLLAFVAYRVDIQPPQMDALWLKIFFLLGGPTILGILLLLAVPFLAVCFSRSSARSVAFVAGVRSIVLSLSGHLLALVAPAFMLKMPYFVIFVVCLSNGFAITITGTLLGFSFLGIVWLAVIFGVLLVVARWLAQPIIRLFLDVFRYTGDSEFRHELQIRLKSAVDAVRGTKQLFLVGHSLGTVVLMDGLQNLDISSKQSSMTLITMGSPIARFFQRFFPNLFFPSNSFQAFVQQREKFEAFRWLNVYRPFDYVGTSIGLPNTRNTADISTGQLFRYHTGYWNDSKVQSLIMKWIEDCQLTTFEDLKSLDVIKTELRGFQNRIVSYVLPVIIFLTLVFFIAALNSSQTARWDAAEELRALLSQQGGEVSGEVHARHRVMAGSGGGSYSELSYIAGKYEIAKETLYPFITNRRSFEIDQRRLYEDAIEGGGILKVKIVLDTRNSNSFFLPDFIPNRRSHYYSNMLGEFPYILAIFVFGAMLLAWSSMYGYLILGEADTARQ